MAADTRAASVVTDHAFAADPWWERCPVCGLSMAAHLYIDVRTEARMRDEIRALPYRCPACAKPPMTDCTHTP